MEIPTLFDRKRKDGESLDDYAIYIKNRDDRANIIMISAIAIMVLAAFVAVTKGLLTI